MSTSPVENIVAGGAAVSSPEAMARELEDERQSCAVLREKYIRLLRTHRGVLKDTLGIIENIHDPIIRDDLAHPAWVKRALARVEAEFTALGLNVRGEASTRERGA